MPQKTRGGELPGISVTRTNHFNDQNKYIEIIMAIEQQRAVIEQDSNLFYLQLFHKELQVFSLDQLRVNSQCTPVFAPQ